MSGSLVNPQGLDLDPPVAVGEPETYYFRLTIRKRFGLGFVR
jgi:hypothetical protein